MSFQIFPIATDLKNEYLESCSLSIKVGELGCIFPKSWLESWATDTNGQFDLIDLRPLLKNPTSPEINMELIVGQDVLAMPISYADCILISYPQEPTFLKLQSRPFHGNAGMFYDQPPQGMPVALKTFISFNFFECVIEMDKKEPSSILLVDELTIGDTVQLVLDSLELDSSHDVAMKFNGTLIQFFPRDKRRIKQLHPWTNGTLFVQVRERIQAQAKYRMPCQSSIASNDSSLGSEIPQKKTVEHEARDSEKQFEDSSPNRKFGSGVSGMETVDHGAPDSENPFKDSSPDRKIRVCLDDAAYDVIDPKVTIGSLCWKMLKMKQWPEGVYANFHQRKPTCQGYIPHSALAKPVSSLSDLDNLALFIQWEPITEKEKELNEYWEEFRNLVMVVLLSMNDPPRREECAYRVGLVNPGSACFLTSVLQCLMRLRDLREYFKHPDDLLSRLADTTSLLHHFDASGRLINFCWKNRPQCNLVYWFLHLFQFVQTGEHNQYDPHEILKHLCESDRGFRYGESNDALMCLCALMDSLHNFLAAAPGLEPVDAQQVTQRSSIIDALFTFQTMTSMNCRKCDHKTLLQEQRRFLTLDIDSSTMCPSYVVYVVPEKDLFLHRRPLRVTVSLQNPNISLQKLASILQERSGLGELKAFLMDRDFTNPIPANDCLFSELQQWKLLCYYENLVPDTKFVEFSSSYLASCIPPLPVKEIAAHMVGDEACEAALKCPSLEHLQRLLQTYYSRPRLQLTNWDGERLQLSLELESSENVRTMDFIWHSQKLVITEEVDAMSLNDVLENFTAPTQLREGSDVCCAQCGSTDPHDKTTQTSLSVPPHVLVLHLRRFPPSDDPHQRKNMSHVFCPSTLDISKYVVGADRVPKYQLVAAVCHGGEYINGGHYVAFCRPRDHHSKEWPISVNSPWTRFDDTLVNDVATLPINETVLLFYEAVSTADKSD